MARLNRREILLAGGAAAAVGCVGGSGTPTDVPLEAAQRAVSPEPPSPALPVDLGAFPWGIFAGDPTPTSVLVSVAAELPVELVLMGHAGTEWEELERVVVHPVGLTCKHEFTDLAADGVYAVWAERHGGRSEVTRFRTAPEPDALRRVVIGATSCMGFANPTMPNLAFVQDHDVDFFLYLGDTCYTDGATTRASYIQKWDGYLRRENMRKLVAATSMMMTWDDHEVANNWSRDPHSADYVPEEQIQIATEVWQEIFPMRPGHGAAGVWRTQSWGQVLEVFILDCRGERSEGHMMSDEQLDYMIQAVLSSTATFKVVISSVHLTDHFELMNTIQDHDRWQGYHRQRAALVSALADVSGAVVITGDMHFGSVQRVDPEGGPGASLWEVAAGPSGSKLLPIEQTLALRGSTPWQYNTVLENWSWCVLDFDPVMMTLDVDFIGDDGQSLANESLNLG